MFPSSRSPSRRSKTQKFYCDKSFSLRSKRSPLLRVQAVECIIYPIIMPHRADKGRCREFSSFQSKRARGPMPPQTAATLHQFFRHSFPTSWHYDRHICWTWYCLDRFRMERWRRWGRSGGNRGDKIQQSFLEKLVEKGPFKKKKRSLADSVP